MKYLFILLLAVPLIAFAEIYQWTDAQGKIHFGDSPKDGDKAKKVQVRVNVYEAVTYEPVVPATTAAQASPQATAEPKKVILYSTQWCGHCRKAIKYFKDNKIPYVERDIEQDPSARRAYDALGGKGIPIILVGQKRMNGFSIPAFQHIYR